MNKIAFSGENVSISYIWEWYQTSEKAMHREKKRIIDAFLADSDVEDFFVGMTREDVDSYFEEHKRELDFLVCFDIISASEACLRLDYLSRVYEKLKDPVSRKFRALYMESQALRVSQFCNANGWTVDKVIKECASGLNDRRPKLIKLLSDHNTFAIKPLFF